LKSSPKIVASTSSHPPCFKDRIKGEKRPIEPLERMYSSLTAMPNAMAKVPNFALVCAVDVGAPHCGRAVKLRGSLAYFQGRSHDSTLRKSLAKWPTTKEYHEGDRCENTNRPEASPGASLQRASSQRSDSPKVAKFLDRDSDAAGAVLDVNQRAMSARRTYIEFAPAGAVWCFACPAGRVRESERPSQAAFAADPVNTRGQKNCVSPPVRPGKCDRHSLGVLDDRFSAYREPNTEGVAGVWAFGSTS
jgi:hypothetical protein